MIFNYKLKFFSMSVFSFTYLTPHLYAFEIPLKLGREELPSISKELSDWLISKTALEAGFYKTPPGHNIY